jgi:retron-type reverse transcriptase
MKRTGNLWPRMFTEASLYAAYNKASQGKRSHRACFEFARRLGSSLADLADELESGSYQPRPLNRFWVHDGAKPRLIEAPAFRDLVAQHAIYAAISPTFEDRYIDTNFACRVGKGSHAASEWLYAAMRRAPRTDWVLHVDVRKFFYSIDRQVLAGLLAKSIKCRRTLDLMMLFAQRPEPAGIPIGNLLSQTFANVYLNSLDHFCKRVLKATHYARYMDDSIMLAPDRATGLQWLEAIRQHLATLNLEISHHTLQPIKRGVDFVGYRTWRSGRFVRPSLISAIRQDARKGRIESLTSRMGHAMRTQSARYILNHLKDNHHALFDRLPQSHRRHHHPHPALAAA